ncbi:MAG: hypothetical protein EP330_11695 [Deltaproteobacteria bacterium]|nr:MAG: hypothetical protein EP330_11695 [Deltaproteobacteria bacterium]
MTFLVRPYPVAELAGARAALQAATEGDLEPLQALFVQAREALREADPDEVEDIEREHAKAGRNDKAAIRAAGRVADEWEGIVTVGASITDPFRFRGFAWLAASERYELGGSFEDFADGLDFPGVSAEDAALYVALPALIGLGAELPEELPGPLPFEGPSVAELLGLSGTDVTGVDPLDGIAIPAEVVRARFAGLGGAWKTLAARCTDSGLLIRHDD